MFNTRRKYISSFFSWLLFWVVFCFFLFYCFTEKKKWTWHRPVIHTLLRDGQHRTTVPFENCAATRELAGFLPRCVSASPKERELLGWSGFLWVEERKKFLEKPLSWEPVIRTCSLETQSGVSRFRSFYITFGYDESSWYISCSLIRYTKIVTISMIEYAPSLFQSYIEI